MPEKVEKEEEW